MGIVGADVGEPAEEQGCKHTGGDGGEERGDGERQRETETEKETEKERDRDNR